MAAIIVTSGQINDGFTVPLPGSKSESNRALIINALCSVPGKIENLALANDTKIMHELLSKEHETYDAQDAGTVMRFMTAYLAVTGVNKVLTGTERMKDRPIGILVNALRTLGAQIDYLEKEGYPPMQISAIKLQRKSKLEVLSSVSSQFISALLMIAPRLPQGLTLSLTGDAVSTPYIDMTIAIMKHFGVSVEVSENTLFIRPQEYSYRPFFVEADWSGASYWYSLFAMSDLEKLTIIGLKPNSMQGDSALKELMIDFGVSTTFEGRSAILKKIPMNPPKSIDFIKCPDLAQTFAVLCAGLGVHCKFYGLQTLKIKETDRITALKCELQKFGGNLIEAGESWKIIPIPEATFSQNKNMLINTYEDHRMAMAFAPLALKTKLSFDNKEVVRKSYPNFWQHLESFGLRLD